MRFHNLDLNLLVSLDALLNERSVSKAANRVFLSQSAMSDALARLRSYFNDELLVQVGKTMVPTPMAQSLVRPVRDVLIQIQAIAASSPDFDPAKSTRRITIMCSDYTASVLMTRVMPRLAAEAPGMMLEFLSLTSRFQEEFDRGHLDLLIIPHGYASEDHPSELLFTEKFTCVTWSKNRLIGKSMTMEEYLSLGHICVNMGEWRVPTYEAWFLKRFGEERRKVEVVVPTFEMAMKLLTGTTRIATVHLRHAKMCAKQYSLRLIEPPFDIPPLKQTIQWHKYLAQDPALGWFRKLVKEAAADT